MFFFPIPSNQEAGTHLNSEQAILLALLFISHIAAEENTSIRLAELGTSGKHDEAQLTMAIYFISFFLLLLNRCKLIARVTSVGLLSFAVNVLVEFYEYT